MTAALAPLGRGELSSSIFAAQVPFGMFYVTVPFAVAAIITGIVGFSGWAGFGSNLAQMAFFLCTGLTLVATAVAVLRRI